MRRYVYLIRAGDVAKIGCTTNPMNRWRALRPFLSIYGEPILIGYVEGGRADERYAYSLGEPYPKSSGRELRKSATIPDIGEIFPGRMVYRPGGNTPKRSRRTRAANAAARTAMVAVLSGIASAVSDKIESADRTKLSKLAGIQTSHLSLIVNGKRAPSLEVAAKLAHALGITLDELNVYLNAKRKAA